MMVTLVFTCISAIFQIFFVTIIFTFFSEIFINCDIYFKNMICTVRQTKPNMYFLIFKKIFTKYRVEDLRCAANDICWRKIVFFFFSVMNVEYCWQTRWQDCEKCVTSTWSKVSNRSALSILLPVVVSAVLRCYFYSSSKKD